MAAVPTTLSVSSSTSATTSSSSSSSSAVGFSKKARVYQHMSTAVSTTSAKNTIDLGYQVPICKTRRESNKDKGKSTSRYAVKSKGLKLFLDAFYPPEEEEERLRLQKQAGKYFTDPLKAPGIKRERKMIADCASCATAMPYRTTPYASVYQNDSSVGPEYEHTIPSPSSTASSPSPSSSMDTLKSGFGKKKAVKTLAPFQKAELQEAADKTSKKNDTRDLEESEFISGIVILLEQMMLRNEAFMKIPQKNNPVSIFYSTLKQPFSMNYYIGRLVKHMACSRSIFVFALIYLERIKKMDYELRVCDRNVHRIFIVACSVAAKFLEDECYCNEYYQKVGGVPTIKEFNKLEKQFLKTIAWNLNVGPQEFEEVERYLFEAIDIYSDCGDSE